MRIAACIGRPTARFLRKPQSSNEMHTWAVADLLKLFRWRSFCMVVLRLFAGTELPSAERSASPEASTAVSRARRVFPRNATTSATSINQSNVIRIHTRQWQPTLQTRRSSISPHTQQPTGTTRSTEKRNLLAKDNRLLLGQESRGLARKATCRETKLWQWRFDAIETSSAFRRFQKARDRRGVLTAHLCGQSVV